MYLYYSEIPRLSARRELRQRQADGILSEQGVYDLWLAATGDKEVAEKARAQASLQRMRQSDV